MAEAEICPQCGASPTERTQGHDYWGCGTRRKRAEGARPEQSLTCRNRQLETVLTEIQPFVVLKHDPTDPYQAHLAEIATRALITLVPPGPPSQSE